MRIWHEKLLPKLCRQHLLGTWREALGAYKIITEGKKGYRNHPAVKEFANAPIALHYRLSVIRREMLERGYHPKDLPQGYYAELPEPPPEEWQTYEEQVEVLKTKGCECKV